MQTAVLQEREKGAKEKRDMEQEMGALKTMVKAEKAKS